MDPINISPNGFTLLDLLPASILFFGGLVVFLRVTIGDKKSTSIVLGIVFLAAFVGAGFVASKVENDTRHAERATVFGHFEKEYGLKLDETDLNYLRDLDKDGVTRNVETVDGSLKEVLFRVADGKVLPYTTDSEGSWIPMPAKVGAQ